MEPIGVKKLELHNFCETGTVSRLNVHKRTVYVKKNYKSLIPFSRICMAFCL